MKRVGALAAVLMGLCGGASASVSISAEPTSGMSCAAGVCAPTTKNAVLNTNDLAAMLASGDVKVVTANGAVTITVAAPLSWSSAGTLTLDAAFNVSFKAPVAVQGPGALEIVTSDGMAGGDLVFFDGGKVDFADLAGSLTINGNAYTLAGDIATLAQDLKRHVQSFAALAGDVDAAAAGTYRGAPIQAFNGTFEGLGHTIANLSLKGTDCQTDINVGLVSTIPEGSTVRDLHLTKVRALSGSPRAVGGLTGENDGAIVGVTVTGKMSTESGDGPGRCAGTGTVGGLVGENDGSISRSRAVVTVTATNSRGKEWVSFAGGLSGGGGGSIDLSSSAGTVTGTFNIAGGLTSTAATITRSFSTATVTAGGSGGINGTGGQAGGLAALSDNISDSYAMGAVSAACAGGLIGATSGTEAAATSYAIGSGGGGFAGCVGAGVTYSSDYWDTDKSGQGCGSGDCTGVTGLSDAKLRKRVPKGFSKTVWAHDPAINGGYPYLIDNPPQ